MEGNKTMSPLTRVITRVKSIILNPSKTWAEIKVEPTTISDLYRSYALKLPAIPAIAQFIGNAFWIFLSLSYFEAF